MPPPAGFRRWKRYWFQCPHCGYRSYEAIGSSAVSVEAGGVLWRFWCPRCEGIAQLKRPRRVAAFASLRIPVLLMVGKASPLSSRSVARRLLETLPEVELVELEGLGHMAPVTHADVVNKVIARFLEAL